MNKPELRKLKYLSPTSIMLFNESREMFYHKYIVGGLKEPQTRPMAYGSAFDAKIKSHIAQMLGIPGFEFEALFKKQVEPHNQVGEVMECTELLFKQYVSSGCLADLLLDLERRVAQPRMEYELNGVVSLDGEVPLSGRPDLSWNLGSLIGVLDWKVTGMAKDGTTSPKPGYVRLRPGGLAHKEVFPVLHPCGIRVSNMELDSSWATQIAIYGWLLGTPVGSEILACIDQLCGPKAKMRTAQFRAVIGRDFQLTLWERVKEIWEIVNSDWFFRDMTYEQSQKKCDSLSIIPERGSDDEWLSKMSRGSKWD